jgi:hypothetical protein
VPQNIDLEDKIVGSLTLRQFLYLLIGGSLDYAIFRKLAVPGGNPSLAIFLCLPIGLFTIALVFLKVQERPFGEFIAALIWFSIRPRQRVWHRETLNDQPVITQEAKKNEEKKIAKKDLDVNKLHSLAATLDNGGKRVDNNN